MAFTKRQLIPRLRRALKARGLQGVSNHRAKKAPGQEPVDLYLPFGPAVVHVCDRPTKTALVRLSKHREPQYVLKDDGSYCWRFGEASIVFVLLTAAPTSRLKGWIEELSVKYVVLDWEQSVGDAVMKITEEVAAAVLEVRGCLPRIAKTIARGGARGGGGPRIGTTPLRGGATPLRGYPGANDFQSLLDRLLRDCQTLLTTGTMPMFEDELAAVEEEMHHKHFPASLLHLARATEALVIDLSKAWDGREDPVLQARVEAREDELRNLARSLRKIQEADSELGITQHMTTARKQATKLVEGIFGMVMAQESTAPTNVKTRSTINTALSAIKQRWKALEPVRTVFQTIEDSGVVDEITDLRNNVAHCRPEADLNFNASQVSAMLCAVQKLVDQLKIVRDVVTPHLGKQA